MSNRVRRTDAEALLADRPIADDHAPAFGDVQDFLATMRNDFGAGPAPEPRPVLASILDGRRPLRTVAEPAAATPPTSARPAAWLGRYRRPRPATAPWLGRHRWPRPAAAALATGTLLFSGLAVAGALPAPVQRVSANVGASLGVDLPRPSDPAPSPAHISPRTGPTGEKAVVPTTSAVSPSLTRPITGVSGAAPAVPIVPSLRLPSGESGLPPVSPLPAPFGADHGGLLPDVPKVPHVVPSP